ncbi:MAG: O-antigen ligase family protein, partial [Caulobacter sp.]
MPTDGGRARRLAGSETAACLVLTGLVFAAVLAFGASELAIAAGFSALYALFLVGLLAACGWARRDLARLGGWTVPGVLAVLLLAAVLWPLTPWAPGGAHPVWTYAPEAFPAATVDRSAVLLNVVNLLGLFCLYVAARVVGASRTRGRRLLFCLLGAMALYAAFALAQYVSVRGAGRMRATLLGPNSAATVFAAALVMAAAGLAARLRRGGARMLRQGDPRA